MEKTVTFTVVDGEQWADHIIHDTVTMALNEHWAKRRNSYEYVEKRYDHMPADFREKKRAMVESNVQLVQHCTDIRVYPAFAPTVQADVRSPMIDIAGAEYLDFNDHEYLALMQFALNRMHTYQHTYSMRLTLAARDANQGGWLEFVGSMKFQDGGGLVVGYLQRKPGEPFESHS